MTVAIEDRVCHWLELIHWQAWAHLLYLKPTKYGCFLQQHMTTTLEFYSNQTNLWQQQHIVASLQLFSCNKQLHIAMAVINITTKQNCANSNKLLHRLISLVAIHGLPIAMVMRNTTTQQHGGNNFKQQQQCSIWLQEHQTVAMPINTNATKYHHGNIINQQQCFKKKSCYRSHLLQRRT